MPERQVITSLTGTAAPLLTVDSSNPAALDYSSIWLPRQWKKSTPFVTDEVTVPSLTPSGLNLEMSFEIPKFGHMIYDVAVHHNLAPRVVNAPAVLGFYVDHLGYAIVDYFRIYFASNHVYERQAYDLYFRYRQLYSEEKRDVINRLILGDRTIAQRTASFVNGDQMYTDMMLPFSDHFNMALPIVVLSQKTRFVYRTKPLANIVNSQPVGIGSVSTAPNQQDNIELVVKVVHLTGTEADMLCDMARSDPGIAYMIHQEQRQTCDEIGSIVPNFQAKIKLSGITKPIMSLAWALVPTKLVNDTGRNDMFYFAPTPDIGPTPPGAANYTPIVSWAIEANGQTIQRIIERIYSKLYNWYKFNEAPGGDEIFVQNYSMYPHSVNSACGYLDYTTLNNPVLTINFGVGGTGIDPDVGGTTPQQLRVIVIARDYNFWFLKSGNWSRTFN